MNYNPIPTILPAASFSAAADGDALRGAMKGFGTDEQAIIDILTARSNAQRQDISEYFLSEYGRDLIEDLKSELGGRFEDVVVGLMMPPDQYLCKQLQKAMSGIGTNETALTEILCSKNNEEIKKIVKTYEDMYDRPLAEHLCSVTSGDFRRLLTLIVTGARDESGTTNADEARQQAERLYAAGEAKLGTDEEVFYRIIAHASFAQLLLVFEEYKNVAGQTIEQAIKHELSGDFKEAMMAIVEYAQSPSTFFAKRLFKSMDGLGTDDVALIRIIISRSEIDLQNIKNDFERIHDRTLLSAVKSETSGDYKKALCSIIGHA